MAAVAPSLHSLHGTDDTMGNGDLWSRVAVPYQDSMGQCTMQSAREIVKRLEAGKPVDASSYVLDNGCGGGSITRVLKSTHPDCRAMAADISKGMVDSVAALQLPGVDTLVSDAVTLDGIEDNTFTHVTTSAMIQFTPDPSSCMRSMYRVLAPGGFAAIGIWGADGQLMPIHAKACARALPSYKPRKDVRQGSWNKAPEHEVEMKKAGFRDISSVTFRCSFPCESPTAHANWWRYGGNPVVDTWTADFRAQGGDMDKAFKEVERVVKEDYDDGKGIYMEVVVGMGWK